MQFALVLARIAGLFMTAPIFKTRSLFTLAKVAMMLWVTVLFWCVMPAPAHLPASSFTFTLAILNELMIGLIIGFAADMVLVGLEFGGNIIDAQMGLSTGQTLDPTSGNSVTIMAQFLRWGGIMIFFIVNGHHMVLQGIARSFTLLPLGQPVNFTEASQYIVSLAGSIFMIGTQIAMPIILVIFFMDFALGMISRVAPQVNVFQLGFEIKPAVGAVIFMLMTPYLFGSIAPLVAQRFENMLEVMMALSQKLL